MYHLGYDPSDIPYQGPRKQDHEFFPHRNVIDSDKYVRKSKYPQPPQSF